MGIQIIVTGDNMLDCVAEFAAIDRAMKGAKVEPPAEMDANALLDAARRLLEPQGFAVRVVKQEGAEPDPNATREPAQEAPKAKRGRPAKAKPEAPETAPVDTKDETGTDEAQGEDAPAEPEPEAENPLGDPEPEATAVVDPAKVKKDAMDLLRKVYAAGKEGEAEVMRVTKTFGVKKLIDVPDAKAVEMMKAAHEAAAKLKVAV
jgi:hypothetical protein